MLVHCLFVCFCHVSGSRQIAFAIFPFHESKKELNTKVSLSLYCLIFVFSGSKIILFLQIEEFSINFLMFHLHNETKRHMSTYILGKRIHYKSNKKY